MASKQISQNEFITQAVAEEARVAIQTIAMTSISKTRQYSTQDEVINNEAANIHLECK